ncbi:pyridoxamine 5'-phosphate oxidase family protein [Roseiarcaceae bacterium H3SJ34-1]|uniref:pyridoxamine 5'-phosphate oxidase family protein n=1 Tax=Terripilifer ovatus TaxID=3032367 RepID=UPI003AB96E27|nr:pyridoxamine 5'-phosphate oxidase family protein [Roseiarcaceae bacterium H3SJ34-1]
MVELDDLISRLLRDAVADGVPCLVGTASAAGEPQISPKGSVAVFGPQSLSYWERSHRSSQQHIRENPRVVVYYRNPARAAEMPYRGGALRFHGRAKIVESGPDRDRAWDLTIPLEQEKDPDRKGVAILIEVDRVEELSGNVVMRKD